MRVTGQYYRALSGHRDELASTSYELYTDTSVRRTSAVHPLVIGAVPVCSADAIVLSVVASAYSQGAGAHDATFSA